MYDLDESPKPIGVAECQADGNFSTPSWIDCSVTNPDLDQELTDALIETSNPEEVDGSVVDENIQLLVDVSEQDIIDSEVFFKYDIMRLKL